MDLSIFAIGVAVVVVIVALIFAFRSNDQDSSKGKQRKQAATKKDLAPRKKRSVQKRLREVDYDGEGEDDEEQSMLEFLKGSQELKEKEPVKDEKKKEG